MISDCKEYRTAIEDIIGAYFEHGDGPGLRALMQEANRMLIDNAVSHRHEGWEGPAEACPICRAHDALRRAEERRLEQPRICVACKMPIEPGSAYRAEMHGDEHNSLWTCIGGLRAAIAKLETEVSEQKSRAEFWCAQLNAKPEMEGSDD